MPLVTLRDVALRAGVSVKTVSNVVHDVEGRVSLETAERVRRVITELGYRPNLSARRLRTGRSQVLALAVPDLTNPYFAQVAAATIRVARGRGYNVFIEETGNSLEAERRAAQGLDDPTIEGVILAPLHLQQAELVQQAMRVPVVLLGEQEPGVPCDRVSFDNREAARQLALHLIEQGYRRIAVVGCQSRLPNATATRRLEGVALAHSERGARLLRALVPELPPTPYSRHLGEEATRKLLELPRPPDAIFCFADVLAFGAVAAAAELGTAIPGQLGIVGFDGLDEAIHRLPTLTTVVPDLEQMATEAVEAVIARAQMADDRPPVTINCGFEIKFGQSTQRLGPGRAT